MHRNRSWIVLVTGLAAATVMAACAKPPQGEISQAASAIAAATASEGAIYAPSELEKANEALRAANAEVAAQGEKFALMRSYDHAKELLQAAAVAGQEAEAKAVAGREVARTRAEDAVERLTSLMTTVEGDLVALAGCRKSPKGFAQDLELLRGRTDALGGQVATVESATSEARFPQAVEIATALEPQIQALADDLSSARSKLGC